MDAETIRLHPEDVISLRLWVKRFREENIRVFYKDKIDHSPPDLPMHEDHLIVCLQTQFQLDAFWHLGSRFIGIDATHNTTIYLDMMLYTIIAWDEWRHGASVAEALLLDADCLRTLFSPYLATGVLVAWMISSSMRKCQEAALTRRTSRRCSRGGVGLGPSGKQLYPAAPELTAWRERPADSSQ